MSLFNFFKKGSKVVETAVAENNTQRVYGLRAGIPVDKDYVFEVKRFLFVGMYRGTRFGKMEFIVSNGVLYLNENVKIKALRIALLEESYWLQTTKCKIKKNQVVRSLKLKDIIA